MSERLCPKCKHGVLAHGRKGCTPKEEVWTRDASGYFRRTERPFACECDLDFAEAVYNYEQFEKMREALEAPEQEVPF